ncbi:hypothetical protein Tco_0941728 [Tanacetum coccineum]|uniref:Uncharacterized protein n=1 Tax=Tanacetum coccineum TaxID=301880 RepID=A0ABQ5DUF4_9ASTR
MNDLIISMLTGATNEFFGVSTGTLLTVFYNCCKYTAETSVVAEEAARSKFPYGFIALILLDFLWGHADDVVQKQHRHIQLQNINPDKGSNEGLPHFCLPPLGGEQGKKKLINQLSPAAYLHLGYGATSVSTTASPGSLLLGKRTSSAPGSCQLPRPNGTHDALSNQCRLVYLNLLLRRCRMTSWDNNLEEATRSKFPYGFIALILLDFLWGHADDVVQKQHRHIQLRNINPDRGSNEGLPHFCSPPLGGEQGKKKLINQLSPAAYLHPGYGSASVSMAASPGSLLPGKQTNSAPGSCQLLRPDGTHDALSNQCRLVYLDLLLRRCRMASWDSNLVDSFIDHI